MPFESGLGPTSTSLKRRGGLYHSVNLQYFCPEKTPAPDAACFPDSQAELLSWLPVETHGRPGYTICFIKYSQQKLGSESSFAQNSIDGAWKMDRFSLKASWSSVWKCEFNAALCAVGPRAWTASQWSAPSSRCRTWLSRTSLSTWTQVVGFRCYLIRGFSELGVFTVCCTWERSTVLPSYCQADPAYRSSEVL